MQEGVTKPMAKKNKNIRSKARTKSVAKRTAKAKTTRAKAAARPATVRPKGMQSLAAGFTANDAEASIKWYCDVLGFKLAERWEKDGVFLGGSVVHGGVTVNIGQDDWKLGRDRQKGQGVRVYITTADDVDAYADAIKSRGGALDQDPKDDWGFRAFSVTDPSGFKITIMRPLK